MEDIEPIAERVKTKQEIEVEEKLLKIKLINEEKSTCESNLQKLSGALTPEEFYKVVAVAPKAVHDKIGDLLTEYFNNRIVELIENAKQLMK